MGFRNSIPRLAEWSAALRFSTNVGGRALCDTTAKRFPFSPGVCSCPMMITSTRDSRCTSRRSCFYFWHSVPFILTGQYVSGSMERERRNIIFGVFFVVGFTGASHNRGSLKSIFCGTWYLSNDHLHCFFIKDHAVIPPVSLLCWQTAAWHRCVWPFPVSLTRYSETYTRLLYCTLFRCASLNGQRKCFPTPGWKLLI